MQTEMYLGILKNIVETVEQAANETIKDKPLISEEHVKAREQLPSLMKGLRQACDCDDKVNIMNYAFNLGLVLAKVGRVNIEEIVKSSGGKESANTLHAPREEMIAKALIVVKMRIESDDIPKSFKKGWQHTDFANWLVNEYKSHNGDRIFATPRFDEDKKRIRASVVDKYGSPSDRLLKELADLFRDLKLDDRIRGRHDNKQ